MITYTFSPAYLKHIHLKKPGISGQQANIDMQAEWKKLKVSGKICDEAVQQEIDRLQICCAKIKCERQLTLASFGLTPPTAKRPKEANSSTSCVLTQEKPSASNHVTG